ncbi:MAG: hypothetical protein ACFFCW_38115 [Candidatus Hodarchaeota archaeon]
MNEENKCLRCGGTNLEPGSIQSNGRVCFRPKKVKFLSIRSADVCVKANICIDCGHMEFLGDAKKTKLLVKASSSQKVRPADLSAAEEETEEKILSCAKEIKDYIELINNSSNTSKPNRGHKYADINNTVDKKSSKRAGNHKATSNRDGDKSTKSSEKGVSAKEMVGLVAKAEKNVSIAVAKSKVKDDKNAKGVK